MLWLQCVLNGNLLSVFYLINHIYCKYVLRLNIVFLIGVLLFKHVALTFLYYMF